MVRLASLALVGAALAANFVEATPAGCNCSVALAKSTCTPNFLSSVTTSGSALNVCAVNAFSSAIPNTTVVNADGSPLGPSDSTVTVLVNILAGGNNVQGKGGDLSGQITLVQPFGQAGVNTIASKFAALAIYKSQGVLANCTKGATYVYYPFNISDAPNYGLEALGMTIPTLDKLCDLSNVNDNNKSAVSQALFGSGPYDGVYTQARNFFLYGFALELYAKLLPCLYNTCSPLVNYLCSIPYTIDQTSNNTLPTSPGFLLSSAYSSITLVDSAVQITGLSNTVIQKMYTAYNTAKNTPSASPLYALEQAILSFYQNVPADGNPATVVTVNNSLAAAFEAYGNKFHLPCTSIAPLIGTDPSAATGNAPTPAPTKAGAASAFGASAVSAVVALSAALFAL